MWGLKMDWVSGTQSTGDLSRLPESAWQTPGEGSTWEHRTAALLVGQSGPL